MGDIIEDKSIVSDFIKLKRDDSDGTRVDNAKLFIVKKYSVIYRLRSI